MLPDDSKTRHEAEKSAMCSSASTQMTLDSHVQPVQHTISIKYTNEVFEEAAEDWLIATDQVCSIAILYATCAQSTNVDVFLNSRSMLLTTRSFAI